MHKKVLTSLPLSRRKGKVLLEWFVLASVIVCGDLATQKIEHSTKLKSIKQEERKEISKCSSIPNQEFEVDFQRLKGVAVTGFGFLAPIALAWYPLLHRFMARNFSQWVVGSAKYVMMKVALENILLPTPVCFGYFVIPAMVEGGHQWESLRERLRADFVSTVAIDTAFWCVVSPFNYKYVTLKYQPLFACVVDGVEAAGLSYLTHQDAF